MISDDLIVTYVSITGCLFYMIYLLRNITLLIFNHKIQITEQYQHTIQNCKAIGYPAIIFF